VLIFLRLPKPIWLYVVGHELTHALWTWGFGGRVKSFRATARVGHVSVTKSNFLIVLSPYFFPLFAITLVLFFSLSNFICDLNHFIAFYHFRLGVIYAFNATFTMYILRIRQPDLESEGWLFSAIIVWMGNLIVLLVGIPLLTRSMNARIGLEWTLQEIERIY